MKLIEEIGEPATLELLAEECIELSHAALKLARVERGENPSPVKKLAAVQKVLMEMADTQIAISEICQCDWFSVDFVTDTREFKRNRMEKRINDSKRRTNVNITDAAQN